jgi:hypothetical protein
MVSRGKLSNFRFKQVIVDEATKASEYEVIFAFLHAEQFVVIGDPLQSSCHFNATILNKENKTLFTRLYR